MFSVYCTFWLYLTGLLFAKVKIELPDVSILAIKVNLASLGFSQLFKSKALGVVGGGKENHVYMLKRVHLRMCSSFRLAKVAMLQGLIENLRIIQYVIICTRITSLNHHRAMSALIWGLLQNSFLICKVADLETRISFVITKKNYLSSVKTGKQWNFVFQSTFDTHTTLFISVLKHL